MIAECSSQTTPMVRIAGRFKPTDRQLVPGLYMPAEATAVYTDFALAALT